jgi:hypothetical protein
LDAQRQLLDPAGRQPLAVAYLVPETVVLCVDKALDTVKMNRLAKTVTLMDLKGYNWMERSS